jgi:hypothetical protein
MWLTDTEVSRPAPAFQHHAPQRIDSTIRYVVN